MICDYRNVKITDGFWKQKTELNRLVTIPAVYDRFTESGRIEAFKFNWKPGMENEPHYFWDSDVAKWMEGAAYVLAQHPDEALQAKVEDIINDIEKNQCEDGYFNIYHTIIAPELRFKDRSHHELYCAGHLIEAACAYYEATGRDRFLRIMEKYTHLIYKVFVCDKSAAFVTPGHEEIEIALYRLYVTTGNKDYLDLCGFFINNRGLKEEENNARYTQSHLPVREQKTAIGHAVRAGYLYSAMADYAKETGDKELREACLALFNDIVGKKMYITGAIGSTGCGEAFTVAYDLPNPDAYAETCAAISLAFFAHRMFALEAVDKVPSSIYEDIVELELYNGALSGLSLDGERFFYTNLLEINLEYRNRYISTDDNCGYSITERVRSFWCSCCPPNVNRFLGSVGNYFYGYDEKNGALYINQFGDSTFEKDGIKVVQKTVYPTDGKVKISSNTPVYVRIPGWCKKFTADAAYEKVGGYAKFEAGEFEIELDMTVTPVAGSHRIYSDFGKAAIRRGPVIYCAEVVDNDVCLRTLAIDLNALGDIKVESSDDFGIPTLTVPMLRREDSPETDVSPLYHPISFEGTRENIKMIPYYAFANRGESDMNVFFGYIK